VIYAVLDHIGDWAGWHPSPWLSAWLSVFFEFGWNRRGQGVEREVTYLSQRVRLAPGWKTPSRARALRYAS
jgi:hypothetical protein